MQENNAPALDRDMAELIRIQKKQLIHQRILTVLVTAIVVILIVAGIKVRRMIPEIRQEIETISASITESIDSIISTLPTTNLTLFV